MIFKTLCEHTGIETTYTYGPDKSRGIIKVELNYPKEYLKELEESERKNSQLPKYKQKFLNPATGKEVSYFRAKNLGLVK